MKLFGYDVAVTKAAVTKAAVDPTRLPTNTYADTWNYDSVRSGWFPVIREFFTGAWQRGEFQQSAPITSHSMVWACATLIASDISKLDLCLQKQDATSGIYLNAESATFSPVLRKPNHYQTRIEFIYTWIISKLLRGNTYILLERDKSRDVSAMYPLDPTRVKVLVSPRGSVFYELATDNLAGLEESVTVPATEIIHDKTATLFHPLCGLSPLHACALAAMQGLNIQRNTDRLFLNGSQLTGVLTAPASISQPVADRIQKHWDSNFTGPQSAGRVAVLGDGLHFEPMTMTAVDAQLIEQLKWTDEKVCSCFHVPPYMVGLGPPPPYANSEPLLQLYYSQCLQALIESLELHLVEGLGADDAGYCVELEIEGLSRMDSATKMKMATDGVKGTVFTPNEARQMFNKPPIEGGDDLYLQVQNYSVGALAKRDSGMAAPHASGGQDPPAATDPPAAAARARAIEVESPDDLALIAAAASHLAGQELGL